MYPLVADRVPKAWLWEVPYMCFLHKYWAHLMLFQSGVRWSTLRSLKNPHEYHHIQFWVLDPSLMFQESIPKPDCCCTSDRDYI